MAVLTVTSKKSSLQGYDYTRSLGELLDLKYAEPLGGSATLLSFQLTNGAVLRLSGTGFAYDDDDLPTAGTVTELRLFLGSSVVPLHAVSGLTLSLVAVMDQAEANWGNPWLLQDWMLGGNDTIDARSSYNAELYGGRGNDVFHAGRGSFMEGGQGRDTYNGGGGFDTVSFQDAHWDSTAFQGVVANLTTRRATDPWGNSETLSSIEEVRGTQFADRFTGSGAAHEEFMGLGGRDIIDGGGGFDIVRYDHDELHGGLRAVTVDLAAGYAIDSFGRRDTLVSIEGATGSGFEDELYGTNGVNKFYGMDGSDILDGRGGADELHGGYGGDRYYIDNINDRIIEVKQDSSEDIDIVYSSVSINISDLNRHQGNIEHVYLMGSARNAIGNSTYNSLNGNGLENILRGGAGIDSLHGGNGNDALFGDGGRDRLLGDNGDDVLNGGNDDDWLIGGEGADALGGGEGRDWAMYSDSAISLVVSLADPTKNTRLATGDTYVSIENLAGGRKGDVLEGDHRANVLDGGGGSDVLTGGGGSDGFRFDSMDGGRDTITDFVVGADRIELDSRHFGYLGLGTLASSAFTVSTSGQATSESHHIIYNPGTGRLLHDRDGSGSSASTVFANLTPGLSLTHEDIRVVAELDFFDIWI